MLGLFFGFVFALGVVPAFLRLFTGALHVVAELFRRLFRFLCGFIGGMTGFAGRFVSLLLGFALALLIVFRMAAISAGNQRNAAENTRCYRFSHRVSSLKVGCDDPSERFRASIKYGP